MDLIGNFACYRRAAKAVKTKLDDLRNNVFRVYDHDSFYVLIMLDAGVEDNLDAELSELINITILNSVFKPVENVVTLSDDQLEALIKYRKHLPKCDFPEGDAEATQKFLDLVTENFDG